MIGDLIRGRLLQIRCGACRPEWHLYINPEILNPEILAVLKRMPVCGARNGETYRPIIELGQAGLRWRIWPPSC